MKLKRNREIGKSWSCLIIFFYRYWLSIFYVLSMVLEVKEIVMSIINIICIYMGFSLVGKIF